ncbi:MAG: hypothetical protein QNJ55_19440 [Xenococcus sp. MO_188.B8]|nr:hypothetical protein [Xenococcus sp. MO_188.B8]
MSKTGKLVKVFAGILFLIPSPSAYASINQEGRVNIKDIQSLSSFSLISVASAQPSLKNDDEAVSNNQESETSSEEGNEDDLDELVQKAVDRAFNTNTLLLNILIAALAALATLLGVVSIIAGLYFFILRKSVEKTVRNSIEKDVTQKMENAIEEMTEKLDEVKSETKEQAEELKHDIEDFQNKLDTLKSEFDKLQIMRKINDLIVDLPPKAIPLRVKIKLESLLNDAKELLKSESLFLTSQDYINLGLTFFSSEQYDKALELYDRALEKDSSKSDYYVYRARALYYMDEFEKSLLSCDTAIELNPLNCRAWNVKGTNFGKLAENRQNQEEQDEYWKKEYDAYQEALKIDPKFSLTLYNLACHYSINGIIDKGFKYLREAVRLNSETIVPQAKIDPDLNNLRKNNAKAFRALLYGADV